MSFDFPILNYIQENFKSDFMDDLMTFSAEDFAESLLAKPAEKED